MNRVLICVNLPVMRILLSYEEKPNLRFSFRLPNSMDPIAPLWKKIKARVDHFLLQCYVNLALNFYEPVERVCIGKMLIFNSTHGLM